VSDLEHPDGLRVIYGHRPLHDDMVGRIAAPT
jgi:hypothetical protein